MTSINILETENQGDVTRVRVQLESEEIFSVKRVLQDSAPERVEGYSVGEYHTALHTDRIEHDHRFNKRIVTAWVENPYTEAKLSAELAGNIADMEATPFDQCLHPISGNEETCHVNGVAREYYHPTRCPSAVTDRLLAAFPDYDLDDINAISAPMYHEVVEQTVISIFQHSQDLFALTEGDTPLISICRKFCLESGKYYDRCYGFVDDGDSFDFIPDSCTLLAKSYNTNIQEGLIIPDFYDVYFSGDPEVVEAAFGLPSNTGKERTYYAVTVRDGQVVRTKQYCYDVKTLFHGWDEGVARAKIEHNL